MKTLRCLQNVLDRILLGLIQHIGSRVNAFDIEESDIDLGLGVKGRNPALEGLGRKQVIVVQMEDEITRRRTLSDFPRSGLSQG